MFIETYSFGWRIYIILVLLSGNVAAKGYGLGYRGGGGATYEETGYGTVATIFIVIGTIIGLIALCGLMCCLEDLCGCGEDDEPTVDNKDTDNDECQPMQNRTVEVNLEDNERKDDTQSSINNQEETTVLKPPSYQDSFSHSSALLEDKNESEQELEKNSRKSTDEDIEKTEDEEFLRRQKQLDDRRY